MEDHPSQVWFSGFRGEDLNVKVYDGCPYTCILDFSVKIFIQPIGTNYAN
jgi:hypothetical protein